MAVCVHRIMERIIIAINVGKHVCRRTRGSLIENNSALHEKRPIQMYVTKIINKHHPSPINNSPLTNLSPENFAKQPSLLFTF